jgi:hypothetical protein
MLSKPEHRWELSIIASIRVLQVRRQLSKRPLGLLVVKPALAGCPTHQRGECCAKHYNSEYSKQQRFAGRRIWSLYHIEDDPHWWFATRDSHLGIWNTVHLRLDNLRFWRNTLIVLKYRYYFKEAHVFELSHLRRRTKCSESTALVNQVLLVQFSEAKLSEDHLRRSTAMQHTKSFFLSARVYSSSANQIW